MAEEILETSDLTRGIIGAAMTVSNTLGCGFLEKVYENALAVELRDSNLAVEQQVSISVKYKGVVVGDYVADLLVERQVICELKAVKALNEMHMAQCLNYLNATGFSVCLLINFAKPRLEWKRVINCFSLPTDGRG